MAKCCKVDCTCPDCRKLYCERPSTIDEKDFTGSLQILWDKIGGEFASKRDILELLMEVKNLQDIRPIQSILVNQNHIKPNAKGEVELTFEDWIQADEVRAHGTANEVRRVYNGSSNAVSAYAVSELAKDIYKSIHDINTFGIEFAHEVDGRGCPLVSEPSHSKIYILCERGPKCNHFSEWLYLPVNGGQWERVGDKLDLSDVNKRLDELEESYKEVNSRLTNHSTKLYNLYKGLQERLDTLVENMLGPDFIMKLISRIPRASLQLPGLMTPKQLQLLEQLRMDIGAPGSIKALLWLDVIGKPGKAAGIVRWSVTDGLEDVPMDKYEVIAVIGQEQIDIKKNAAIELNDTTTFTVRIIKDGEVIMEKEMTLTKNDEKEITEITTGEIDELLGTLK